MPDADRQWTLEGREKKKGASEKTEPVRQCSNCYFCERPKPVCSNCGFVFPINSREIEQIEGELVEVDKNAQIEAKKQERQEQGRAKTYNELVAHFVMKGSKNPHFQAKTIIDARRRKMAT